MIQRISQLIKSKKISASQFADEIGVQRSSVSHVLSGRNKPSLDFVMKILNTYPDVQPEWLLSGKGSMLAGLDLSDENTEEPRTDFNSIELDEQGHIGSDMKDKSDERGSLPGTRIKKSGHRKAGTGSGSVQKIVLFFNDGTFQEFSPDR